MIKRETEKRSCMLAYSLPVFASAEVGDEASQWHHESSSPAFSTMMDSIPSTREPEEILKYLLSCIWSR